MSKVLYGRVPDEMYEQVEALRLRENRSQNMMLQILLGFALNNYSSAAPVQVWGSAKAVAADFVTMPGTKKITKNSRSIEQAQKRINKKTAKIAADGLEKLKKLPHVGAIESCPHGYAKGMCKKADCNRRYAK